HRVADVGAPDAARRGLVHDLGPAHHRCDGHAAAERLRPCADIRDHTELLERAPRAGTAEATLDLVQDQQYPVLVAESAQPFQVSSGHDVEAAFTLHRLDDDGGQVLGSNEIVREFFQAPQLRL